MSADMPDAGPSRKRQIQITSRSFRGAAAWRNPAGRADSVRVCATQVLARILPRIGARTRQDVTPPEIDSKSQSRSSFARGRGFRIATCPGESIGAVPGQEPKVWRFRPIPRWWRAVGREEAPLHPDRESLWDGGLAPAALRCIGSAPRSYSIIRDNTRPKRLGGFGIAPSIRPPLSVRSVSAACCGAYGRARDVNWSYDKFLRRNNRLQKKLDHKRVLFVQHPWEKGRSRDVGSGSLVACAGVLGNCDRATEGGIPRSSRFRWFA